MSRYLVQSYKIKLELRGLPEDIGEDGRVISELFLGKKYHSADRDITSTIVDIDVDENGSVFVSLDMSDDKDYNIDYKDIFSLVEDMTSHFQNSREIARTFEFNRSYKTIPTQYLVQCNISDEREFIEVSDKVYYNSMKIKKGIKNNEDQSSSYEYVAIIYDVSSTRNFRLFVAYYKYHKYSDRVYRLDDKAYNYFYIDYPMIGLEIDRIITENA